MRVTPRDGRRIFEQNFPATAPIELQLRFLLGYAILAPSTRNTQPWRFAVQGDTVRLFADPKRGQPVADPERRELYISLGCALENLLVAAEHFGFTHEVAYFPEPGNAELAARVTFARGCMPAGPRAGLMADTIVRRHNDSSVYRPVAVPEEARRRLQACLQETDLRLDLTDDHLFRRWVDQLTLEADRLEFGNPAFRQELGSWIGQGVFGTSKVVSRLGRIAVTRLDLAAPVVAQDGEIVESAALLGLISAADDTHLVHVRTGQLFERLWLTATAMGVSVHPMSQTMRVPALRAAMAELVPTGWIPQHLFRIGYSSRGDMPRHRTPRRSLDDVVE